MQQLKPVSSTTTMTEKLTVYKHRFLQCRCVDSTSCWQVQDEGETGGHLKPHFSPLRFVVVKKMLRIARNKFGTLGARGSDDVHPVDDVAKGKQEARNPKV